MRRERSVRLLVASTALVLVLFGVASLVISTWLLRARADELVRQRASAANRDLVRHLSSVAEVMRLQAENLAQAPVFRASLTSDELDRETIEDAIATLLEGTSITIYRVAEPGGRVLASSAGDERAWHDPPPPAEASVTMVDHRPHMLTTVALELRPDYLLHLNVGRPIEPSRANHGHEPGVWFASRDGEIQPAGARGAIAAARPCTNVAGLPSLFRPVMLYCRASPQPRDDGVWIIAVDARSEWMHLITVIAGSGAVILVGVFLVGWLLRLVFVLARRSAERAQVEKELEVARSIQQAMLSSSEPAELVGVTLAGHCQPASECGGDWWTWHQLSERSVLVVVGDVTGHGVPAAMIVASAKAACDIARDTRTDDLHPVELLDLMNLAVYESGGRKFMMTCMATIIDPCTGKLIGANAGHNHPLIVRRTDNGTQLMALTGRGNRLGDRRAGVFGECQATLQSGDVVVWFTDGVVDCTNPQQERYGDKRLRNTLRRLAELDPRAIRDAVLADAAAFCGQEPPRDDITLIVAKLR